jgi:ubiquitin carboxyl-terminal hydrolase 36/42
MLMICLRCKKFVNAEKQFTIHDAPVVLTVHFKRFSPMGRKLAQPIKYDERLSLQPVMSEGQYGPSYSLYGVICHAGSGPNSGHYYGFVKSATGQWYEMNDESVSSTRAPVGLKSAYMLFYIRDKGQALEAAVSQVSIPSKNGVAAGMKKRKVVDSDDEMAGEDTGVKTTRPFIGPQLPSPTPSNVASQPTPNATDPQAEIVKKKIAAASKAKAAQALRDLSLYADDEEESNKEGDSLNGQEDSTPSPNAIPSSAPPEPPVSSPVSPLSIPTDSFYNSSDAKVKKRKSPDEETDENQQSQSDWARKPLYNSPSLTSSSPRFKHKKKPIFGGGNPFNRVRGANNLHQKDSANYKPPVTYKKKRRTFMI